jgi:hypothetical protein
MGRAWKWKNQVNAKRNGATAKAAASRDPQQSLRQARPARNRPMWRWSDVRVAPEGMDEAPPELWRAWADLQPRTLAAAPERSPEEQATRRAWVELTARLIDDQSIDGVELVQFNRESRRDFLGARKEWRETALPLGKAVGDRDGVIIERLRSAVGTEILELGDLGVDADEKLQVLLDDVNQRAEWLSFTITILAGGWAPRD